MSLYDVIKKPIVTEKTATMEMKNNVYVVEVSDRSTKVDIKKAFLDLYWVSVESVNVLNTREKFKHWKKWQQIKRRETKKAFVKLKAWEQKIDFINVK